MSRESCRENPERQSGRPPNYVGVRRECTLVSGRWQLPRVLEMRFKCSLPALLFVLALFGASASVAASVPACNTRLLNRRGKQVNMGLSALARHFNQRLQSSHSQFHDLRLVAQGGNHLKITGEKNGQPVSISGPLTPTSSGGLQLHASQITRNGTPVKGMMDLFGKDLASSVNLQNTPSIYAKGNNLEINVDRLLGVAGHVTSVELHGSRIQMDFASQPCQ